MSLFKKTYIFYGSYLTKIYNDSDRNRGLFNSIRILYNTFIICTVNNVKKDFAICVRYVIKNVLKRYLYISTFKNFRTKFVKVYELSSKFSSILGNYLTKKCIDTDRSILLFNSIRNLGNMFIISFNIFIINVSIARDLLHNAINKVSDRNTRTEYMKYNIRVERHIHRIQDALKFMKNTKHT